MGGLEMSRNGTSEHHDMAMLKSAIDNLSQSLDRQTQAMSSLPDKDAIEALGKRIQDFMDFHRSSIPIFMVVLMFATLLGVIFGKEIIEWVFEHPIYTPIR
jgi:tetrahydromethanopterin S-methyltransferase subunit B